MDSYTKDNMFIMDSTNVTVSLWWSLIFKRLYKACIIAIFLYSQDFQNMLATGDFVSLFGFLEQFKSLGVLPRCVLFSLILTFII